MWTEPERVAVDWFRANDLPAGVKRRLELAIDFLPDGQRLSLPTLVVRGTASGKTLLTVGAVHGDEYEGTVAIQDLYEELDVTVLREWPSLCRRQPRRRLGPPEPGPRVSGQSHRKPNASHRSRLSRVSAAPV